MVAVAVPPVKALESGIETPVLVEVSPNAQVEDIVEVSVEGKIVKDDEIPQILVPATEDLDKVRTIVIMLAFIRC